jgi:polyisoprenoid-binding protein YceI
MSRLQKILIAVVAVVVLVVGGAYAYILFIHDDAPAALDESDLDDALSVDTTIAGDTTAASDGTTPAAGTVVDTVADPTVTTAGTEVAAGTGEPITDATGTWNVSNESTLGYRVSEVLGGIDTEGAGRTNDVAGTLVIDGTVATSAEFTVQMASITSDDDRRDGQFNGRIMSTDEFPTATFVLTQPIDFGSVPAEGVPITASATGDLTLRGVTNSVTFDLTAQVENGRIGVLGTIPILFSDYEIPDPSNGFAEVKDNGSLEFVLVFDAA